MEVKLASKIRIFIDLKAQDKINRWVKMSSGEIQGFGNVERKGNIFTITDVFLPEQKITSAQVESSDAELGKLLYELHEKGLDTGKLKFWWHSHANMDVFWSSTDNETQNEFCGDTFLVSIVYNKKGEKLAKLNIYNPLVMSVDNLPIEYLLPEYDQEEECKAEFDKKVKEHSWVSNYVHYKGGKTFNWWGGMDPDDPEAYIDRYPKISPEDRFFNRTFEDEDEDLLDFYDYMLHGSEVRGIYDILFVEAV